MSVLADRLRIAVVSALALLALLVTLSLLRVADGAAALVISPAPMAPDTRVRRRHVKVTFGYGCPADSRPNS